MAKAKCFHCGATAIDETFEQARKKLDHSVGLSRGVKCGESYGRVKEIKDLSVQKIIKTPTIETKVDTKDTKIETKMETKIEPKIEPTSEEPKKEKTKKSKTKK